LHVAGVPRRIGLGELASAAFWHTDFGDALAGAVAFAVYLVRGMP
jgi:hypothetical protein